jgi:hypothetical protein
MKYEKTTLICTPLRFYTTSDEELFFEWLKKIECIKEFKGIGRELHLHILSKKISDNDLLNLMGIFDRYKFDSQQLRIFINENNKEFFEE